MPSSEWLHFKSGSDIRGVASEGVEGETVTLTDDRVARMAKAFFVFLSKKTRKKSLRIAVGHDSRISAPRLKTCVVNALLEMGATVLDAGLSSTPAMFMITKEESLDCDGSIQLTASHHPFNKNGLKFFDRVAGLESYDITTILNLAEENAFEQKEGGSIISVDFMSTYAKRLVEMVRTSCQTDRPFEGMRIIVDAGNGAGGFYVEEVLKPLGADTTGSQFLEPDGNFPNHVPNPENPVAMQYICEAVLKTNADFGIIFDTDVDRAGAVSADGKEINRNRLIALISAILLKEKRGAYIVTDSVTGDGLAEFIRRRGGIHYRYKRGYKNVINEAVRLNEEGRDCPLAIETSGHAALRENYFLDDGAYLITRILIEMAKLRAQGRTLESLIADLKCAKEEKEIRMRITTPHFSEYGEDVLGLLELFAPNLGELATDSREGVRISMHDPDEDGFLLLRMSVHDPIMPLNIESNVDGGAKRIAARLYDYLSQFDKLDTEKLRAFVEE